MTNKERKIEILKKKIEIKEHELEILKEKLAELETVQTLDDGPPEPPADPPGTGN